MDIQEAVLIKRILDALTGTEGVPVRQLANKCQASPRRVNHLALHLQKIGLIEIDDMGTVSLSEELVKAVWLHAGLISKDPRNVNEKPYSHMLGNEFRKRSARDLEFIQEQGKKFFEAILHGEQK